MGVIFTSSGTIGFFFKFSLFGSIFAVIIGVSRTVTPTGINVPVG
jgi:hypothetical protein